MNVENIPELLTQHPHWCVWQYVENKTKGKPDKIPKQVGTDKRAHINDLTTFTDFKTACSALANFDGLGVAVTQNLIAVDIDNCVRDGTVLEWASEIISRFPDTYIEYSPSECSLRFFLTVSDTFHYDTKRYKMK